MALSRASLHCGLNCGLKNIPYLGCDTSPAADRHPRGLMCLQKTSAADPLLPRHHRCALCANVCLQHFSAAAATTVTQYGTVGVALHKWAADAPYPYLVQGTEKACTGVITHHGLGWAFIIALFIGLTIIRPDCVCYWRVNTCWRVSMHW